MFHAGHIVGNYEIIQPLAGGGMGFVYVARHRRLGHSVAIKVLLDSLAMDPHVRSRFTQVEAVVQANLDHGNIVRVRDIIEEPYTLAIVMDLVPGPTLEEVITEDRTDPWSRADTLAIMQPVVRALAYAHSRTVVHRDMKPANVLLDLSKAEGAIPKITDFGIAKLVATDTAHTRAGSVLGTPPYMAPEQFRGSADVGPEADVFAIGMMFYRLLTGGLPIDPHDQIAVVEMYQGHVPIPAVDVVAPETPDDLTELVTRCLTLDPAERPRNAGEVADSFAQPPPAIHIATPPPKPPPSFQPTPTPVPTPVPGVGGAPPTRFETPAPIGAPPTRFETPAPVGAPPTRFEGPAVGAAPPTPAQTPDYPAEFYAMKSSGSRVGWILGLVAVVVGVVVIVLVMGSGGKDSDEDPSIARLRELTDEMCACHDYECVQTVADKALAMERELTPDRPKGRESRAKLMKKQMELGKRFADCEQRAMKKRW